VKNVCIPELKELNGGSLPGTICMFEFF